VAPHDTNTKRQARRHAFPLIAMGVLLAIVLLVFLWWVAKSAGLTGEAEPVPEGGVQGENTEEVAPPAAPAN
jgi:cytoskeletal protein RodZ